jgi:hypothetical protein
MKVLPFLPAWGGVPLFEWCLRQWRWLLDGGSVNVGCGGAFFVDNARATDLDAGRERRQ